MIFSTEKTILLRQGIGSIVLQKEVLNTPDQDGPQNFYVSNLDQLASAAMSSAGLEPANFEEVVSSHTPVKKKRQTKPKKNLTELEEAIRKSDCTLKHLLTGGNIKEEIEAPDPCSSVKKRKTSLSEIKLEPLGPEEIETVQKSPKPRKHKIADQAYSGTSARIEGTKIIIRDAMSKSDNIHIKESKIHGRKLKQVKRKDDDEDGTELTEPLMSSCLLLLEAATRLDKAEKGSQDGLADNTDGNESLDQDNMEVGEENVIVESTDSEEPLLEFDLPQEVAIDDVKVKISADPHSEGSIHFETDEAGGVKAVKDFLSNYSVNVSDGKIIVTRGSEVRGLSGTRIKGDPSAFADLKSKETVRPSKGRYIITHKNPDNSIVETYEIASNDTESLLWNESAGSHAASSTASGVTMTSEGDDVSNQGSDSVKVVQKVISALANMGKTNAFPSQLLKELKQSNLSASTIQSIAKLIKAKVAASQSEDIETTTSGSPRTIIVTRNPKTSIIVKQETHADNPEPEQVVSAQVQEVEEEHSNSEVDSFATEQTGHIIFDEEKGYLVQFENGSTIPLEYIQAHSSGNGELSENGQYINCENSSLEYVVNTEDECAPVIVDTTSLAGDSSSQETEAAGNNAVSSSTLSLLKSYLVENIQTTTASNTLPAELSKNEQCSELSQTEGNTSTGVLDLMNSISNDAQENDAESSTSNVKPLTDTETESESEASENSPCVDINRTGRREKIIDPQTGLMIEFDIQEDGHEIKPEDLESLERTLTTKSEEQTSSKEPVQEGNKKVVEPKISKYNSDLVMDPTAPLSLGEVPLFASSKGDSDSMSPNSDSV